MQVRSQAPEDRGLTGVADRVRAGVRGDPDVQPDRGSQPDEVLVADRGELPAFDPAGLRR
jgi:hypothetical protein